VNEEARVAFIIAASAIERDVLLAELTDDEIDSLISAVLSPKDIQG